MDTTFTGQAFLWFLSSGYHFSLWPKKERGLLAKLDGSVIVFFKCFCVCCKLYFSEAKITVAKDTRTPSSASISLFYKMRELEMLAQILTALIAQSDIFSYKSYPSNLTVFVKVLMFNSVSTIYQNQIIWPNFLFSLLLKLVAKLFDTCYSPSLDH